MRVSQACPLENNATSSPFVSIYDICALAPVFSWHERQYHMQRMRSHVSIVPPGSVLGFTSCHLQHNKSNWLYVLRSRIALEFNFSSLTRGREKWSTCVCRLYRQSCLWGLHESRLEATAYQRTGSKSTIRGLLNRQTHATQSNPSSTATKQTLDPVYCMRAKNNAHTHTHIYMGKNKYIANQYRDAF